MTALAAGHRPCFECRRRDADTFAALFSGTHRRASATEMDRLLHAERLAGRVKRLHVRVIDTLPDGVMIVLEGEIFAVRGNALLRWTPAGYTQAVPRPRGTGFKVLTPPSILAALARGYAPLWHASAG